MASLEFPHEMRIVTEEEDKIIKKYYKSYVRSFIRVGPSGYLNQAGYGDHAAEIYNLEVRSDDIWVTTFSRSGTTWIQELVWLVMNNLDYKTALSVSMRERYAFIEHTTYQSELEKEIIPPGYRSRGTRDDFQTLPNLPSPRFVKSHLPLSLLPPKLLDTAKVFYVARDPRDVAVSFYFAHILFKLYDESVQLKEFWDLFRKDLVTHTPIFPHIKEAWDKRHHPNILFLFYEEMQNDLRSVIDRVCKFVGKDYSDEQKQHLAEHLKFSNMKKKPPVAFSVATEAKDKAKEVTFFRKGKSGNWVNYFDEEMMKQAEEFMDKNLKLTDMRFPVIKNH